MLERKVLVGAPVPGRKISTTKIPNSKILCSFLLFKNILEKNGAKKAIAENWAPHSFRQRGILRPSYLESDRMKLRSGSFMLLPEARVNKPKEAAAKPASAAPKQKNDEEIFTDADDFYEPDTYKWKRAVLDDA